MAHDDHGLHADLAFLRARRRLIGGLVGAGAVLSTGSAALAAECVRDASETAGPFPADGRRTRGGNSFNVLTESGVIREDIRPSFAGMTPVADGAELRLTLTVVDAGRGCTPLAGRPVYIWQCDAVGRYSLYEDADRNYLRGVGITDAAGQVQFTTVFPGCYLSRAPHVHFEVFASEADAGMGENSVLIGQLAFDDADSATVYAAHAAYDGGLRNLSRNPLAQDFIFRDDTAAQTAQRTVRIAGDPRTGLTGTATIGL